MYHVDFASFEEYKNELQKKIDAFYQQLDGLYTLKDNLEWQGETYETAMDIFNDKMKDLYVIPEILKLYIKFIDVALTNYQDGIEEIKNNFSEIIEAIKAEKRKRGEIVNE